ncbi:DEAD-domain-containing protein [Coniophora puteana RWD-64-598 SS2]|uniref:DNA 3'-5' helicase n=1 Tax=Coniophora puteana (strain RWD-64-598) TaxID=741705 RepID=A0A5M3N0E3_CONPW|nr:DEAD-domain-containing protein [Coniophora puteana RWD-64-598 SS2]EIW84852.1 DEAD-domain-containing protein [Coniophora puteana RWD-64-598 SS2]
MWPPVGSETPPFSVGHIGQSGTYDHPTNLYNGGHFPIRPQEYSSFRRQSGSQRSNDVIHPPAPQHVSYNDYSQTRNEAHPSPAPQSPQNARLRLRPVSDLPDVFRSVFKFGVFNAIQSTCLDAVLKTPENLVSLHNSFSALDSSALAPTGSGKTVLFELSIIRMLSEASVNTKCVYVAPTKALCAEKFKEWSTKFSGLGIKICELTGDTVTNGKGVWGDAKSARVIVTTAEKWDSLTRNWGDHARILSQIQLFLVDEVHILNESRGSTLEVIVARMKKRGSSVRFILVSATVPNIQDVASWIGSSASSARPAQVFQFGDEYRPCKLSRHVYGIGRPKGLNDFAYAHTLDGRLFEIMQRHSVNKPILVFCSTRKGTVTTAKVLAKEYEQAMKNKHQLPWNPPPKMDFHFKDKDLAALAAVGIAFHHAGLNLDDRKLVEELYLKKTLRVLTATSTLAVGVNLPAHTVVIKGVKVFQNGQTKEYSDLDMMQMMGRAGRPQFDKDGVAIIMCEPKLEDKYRELAQGSTLLESNLHTNLTEHLNSEITLGTITDVNSAKSWLRQSFFYCRIQQNPDHYSVTKDADKTWQDVVDDIILASVDSLRQSELVESSEGGADLRSTEYGDIMSKFYVKLSTMKTLLGLSESANVRNIVYEQLRRHDDIRFTIKKVQTTSDKVFLLIQAVLAGVPLNTPEFRSGESQPYLEAFSIFRHVVRIANAALDISLIKKNGNHVKFCLELVRCLNAKAWEDRPIVLRQIEHIGEKSLTNPRSHERSQVLAEHGISSVEKLASQTAHKIEMLLNRRHPFGVEVLAAVCELPKYFLTVQESRIHPSDGKSPVEVELDIQCGLIARGEASPNFKKSKHRGGGRTTILTITSENDFIDYRCTPTKALKDKKSFTVTAQLTKPSQFVTVYISSESDLAGLEEDPDFWNMNPDDNDEVTEAPVKDLTASRGNNTRDKKQAKLQGMSTADPEHRKTRLDGKYECNHTCKDKTACRHLCCRDGLSEPSKPSRKRSLPPTQEPEPLSKKPKTAQVSQAQPTSEKIYIDSPKEKSSSKRPKTKAAPVLRQLDTLHKNSNVRENIMLSEGRRIKVDIKDEEENLSTVNSKGKSKFKPNFDMDFTTLRRSKSPEDLVSSDNEELRDLSDILRAEKGKNKLSSETHWSSSEVDELIRKLPLDQPSRSSFSEVTVTSVDRRAGAKPSTMANPSWKPRERSSLSKHSVGGSDRSPVSPAREAKVIPISST